MRVYVKNLRGEPLMPTTPRKARLLIEKGKAKVVKRTPFTIQLNQASGETKQEIVLGVDCGYQHIGLSAVMKGQELYAGEVKLRTNIIKKLSDRRICRRARRSRLWHRKPRFLNRVSTKKKGWLAPSIQYKLDSHIRIIEQIKKLLPITKIIIEVANFDIQKIKNPDIKSEQYQQGPQLDFWNVREYVLYRDNHTCQYCKKKNQILNVHHMQSRKMGGNRPDNLTTLCKKCHKKLHNNKIELKTKKTKGFKEQTFMSTIRWKLVDSLKSLGYKIEHTYGYLTKSKRIEQKLQKSHVNDAFVIAEGTNQVRSKQFEVKQVRRNNRCLQLNRKGYRPSIRRQRYEIQPKDLVKVNNKIYTIKGIHHYGKYCRLDNGKDIKTENVSILKHQKGFCFELQY